LALAKAFGNKPTGRHVSRPIATVMMLITTFTSVPCSIPCSAFYMQLFILIVPMIGTSNNIIRYYQIPKYHNGQYLSLLSITTL